MRKNLEEEDPRRSIKHDVHQALDCFFSDEELERLRKVKTDPSWRPASDRQGFKRATGFETTSKRHLKFLLDELKKEASS